METLGPPVFMQILHSDCVLLAFSQNSAKPEQTLLPNVTNQEHGLGNVWRAHGEDSSVRRWPAIHFKHQGYLPCVCRICVFTSMRTKSQNNQS